MHLRSFLPLLFITSLHAADFPAAVTGQAWSWNNPQNPEPGWQQGAEMLILPRGMLIQASADLKHAVFAWKSTGGSTLVFGDASADRTVMFAPGFTSYKAREEWNGNELIKGQPLRPLAPVKPADYTPAMRELETALLSRVWSWADVGQKGKGGTYRTLARFEPGNNLHPDEIPPNRQWQWWITGPRHVHVQYTWDPANPRPGFIADVGGDLWFDDKLTRFQGITHNHPVRFEWAIVRGEKGVEKPGWNSSSAAPSLSAIQTDASQPRIQVIKEQGPNATEWALTPLNEAIPQDIRQNLTYLREDLLDEVRKNAKSTAAAYQLASTYCDKILAALSQREIARVNAGYGAAQADASKATSTQALDARRNHKMSWPQHAREEAQRTALRENETDKADVKKERHKVEWAARAEQMRLHLDALYRQLREAMR